jgi:hypothetical protein
MLLKPLQPVFQFLFFHTVLWKSPANKNESWQKMMKTFRDAMFLSKPKTYPFFFHPLKRFSTAASGNLLSTENVLHKV